MHQQASLFDSSALYQIAGIPLNSTKWYSSRVPPIVPQNRFGVAVLLLCYLNSTANQNWGCGTFITCGTFIRYVLQRKFFFNSSFLRKRVLFTLKIFRDQKRAALAREERRSRSLAMLVKIPP